MRKLVAKFPDLFAAIIVVAIVLLVIGPVLFCSNPPEGRQITLDTQNVVYLKSGGDFANYCKVSNKNDYDRIVNFRNVSTLRKIEDKRLVVDNRLIILFSDSVSRDNFIKEVGY